MSFTEFMRILKSIIGGSYSTHSFTRTVFETIIEEQHLSLAEDVSDNTYKAYYNGNTNVKEFAKRIFIHIEPEQLAAYLDQFPDEIMNTLTDAFAPYIGEITPHNAPEKIAYYFKGILAEAAGVQIKNPSFQDDETESLELPKPGASSDCTYSSVDKALLREFTSDYDEIMLAMIGESYADALIEMKIVGCIKDLYDKKWNIKADKFSDPILKSYVYRLLGELQQLTDSLLKDDSGSPSIRKTRLEMRNLYVKLHPELYVAAFPYDALIDDWEDGEF